MVEEQEYRDIIQRSDQISLEAIAQTFVQIVRSKEFTVRSKRAKDASAMNKSRKHKAEQEIMTDMSSKYLQRRL